NILPEFLTRQRQLSTNHDSSEESLALEELSILCRDSTAINDRVILCLVPLLSKGQLRSLSLAGCSKLSGKPLLVLLPYLQHLQNLALEACNLDPTFYTLAGPSISQLKSLKLTHPGPRHPSLPDFFPALETLLQHTRQLSAFTLYYSGASTGGRREWPAVSTKFVSSLTESIGTNLRKFELSGVLIDIDSVEILTNGSRRIRDLVLHLGEQFDLAHLTACFAPLTDLRSLHILCQRADVTPDDVLGLAKKCSSTLRQIGFRNRVWILRRSIIEDRIKIRFTETAAAFGAFRRNKYGAEEDIDFEADLDAQDESLSDNEGEE
ncbi:hypothetical protein JCM5350_002920, partial [Sporobolomyces pararoseus]